MEKSRSKAAPEEPEASVPADLRAVLAADPKARDQWKSLTPVGRRDFLGWIDAAKQPETRKRRVDSVPSRLASGKKRPCCYAVVPFSLYKALAADPKAKARWGAMTPLEKRDFTDWVNKAANAEEQRFRSAKACAALAAGKKRP